MCICAFFLHASLSTSEFQGASKQKPRFSQSCAQPKKWITTLQRQCERLTSLMQANNLPSKDLVGSISTIDKHRKMLKLAQHMTNNFYVRVSVSPLHAWTMLWSNSGENDGIRAMTHKSIDNLGEPHGIILIVATSIWLLVSPQCVLQFFCDESLCNKLDFHT